MAGLFHIHSKISAKISKISADIIDNDVIMLKLERFAKNDSIF